MQIFYNKTMLKIIAAVAQNGVIGANGKLPFNLPLDMARFVSLTTDNVVIMGKSTYLSIGSPLKNRINIVVSSTIKQADGVILASDLSSALNLAKNLAADTNKDIFVIGGQSLYKECLPLADMLYITKVNASPVGDAYFPPIPDSFSLIESEYFLDNGTDTVFCTYINKKNL